MNNAINSFLKFVPSDDWILKNSGLPWLELNLEVPDQQILQEANQCYKQAVEHRSDDKLFGQIYSNQGWKSVCIYGESSSITHQTSGKKQWTEIADKCPHTVEWIKQHWNIDDTTGRIRFMWLDPGGYILPHQDRESPGFFETNVAITNPDQCQFRFLNYGSVPFSPGSAFLVDISNKHFVYNASQHIRTHVIIHAKLKEGITKTSYAQNFYR
jgi:hypothetical protein